MLIWMLMIRIAMDQKLSLSAKKHFGESYIYAVQDYSNKGLPNSNYLSASKAKVFVYVGSSPGA